MKVKQSIILTMMLYISCLAFPAECLSQNQETKKVLTLHQCMEYAVENSAKMRIQKAWSADDRVNRKDAYLNAFTPSISASTQAGSNFGRTIDPETNTYVSTTSFNNSYSVSAGIVLFNGFEAVNNIKTANTARAMGVSKEQQMKDEICLNTMQAYYNVVYYTELTEILEKQVKTAQEALNLVRRQEELGQKGYSDLVETEAKLADTEYELITARNQMNEAYTTLKDIMFWPADKELLIDTTPADAQAIQILDAETDIRKIMDNAIETNPSIHIARTTMDKAKIDLATSKWKLLPSLSLYGGWSTNYYTYPGQKGYVPTSFGKQFRDNGGEYIQLSLSIPIFDKLSKETNIARKKNAYARASAQYEQKIHEVQSEIRRAIQDRDGAASAFYKAEKRAGMQEEAYRLNSKKFELGLISTVEYQTVSDNYLKSKAERLNSLLQYYIKKSIVSYYNGISYIDQQ